jgi:hypothetical protein
MTVLWHAAKGSHPGPLVKSQLLCVPLCAATYQPMPFMQVGAQSFVPLHTTACRCGSPPRSTHGAPSP